MPSQFQVRGQRAFLSVVNQFELEARKDGREKWVVGTRVGYGQHHEFGTSRGLRARPHWRPAIFTLSQGIPIGSLPGVRRRRTSLIQVRGRGMARREWELWWEPEKTSGGATALALKKEVKKQIKAKGVFKTGNYHGSIAHGKGEAQMLSRSKTRMGMEGTSIL